MIELTKEEKKLLERSIRIVKDFPKAGIVFRDITTLLNDKKMLSFLLDHLCKRYENNNYDFVAGIESRGFIFASMLCARLKLPFVPIRKPKKLPYDTFYEEYDLEYGKDRIEIHKDAFLEKKGSKVLLVDDLIATGGTAIAAYKLINKTGANCLEACFLINLKDLGGEKRLKEFTSVYSVLEF